VNQLNAEETVFILGYFQGLNQASCCLDAASPVLAVSWLEVRTKPCSTSYCTHGDDNP